MISIPFLLGQHQFLMQCSSMLFIVEFLLTGSRFGVIDAPKENVSAHRGMTSFTVATTSAMD